MENILVSVIVAAYNVEPYIKECVESILKQTYKYIEIIIIDDGSKDSTGDICEVYARNYNNIKVLHKKNKGLVAARKDGLRIARGQYISFVDGDDTIEAEFVQVLLSDLVASGADLIHSGYQRKNGMESYNCCRIPTETKCFENDSERYQFIQQYVIDQKVGCITYSIWSKMFKSAFIKECYIKVPDEQSYGEDLICLLYCLEKCQKIRLKAVSLYHYNVHVGSMTQKNKNIIWENELKLCSKLIEIKNETESYFLQEIISKLCRNKIWEMWNKTCTFKWNNVQLLYNKRVIVYGIGKVGEDYIRQLDAISICEIVSIVDKKRMGKFGKYQIEKIDTIQDKLYDYILIAVSSYQQAKEIKNELLKRNISPNKILWDIPLKE